MDKYKTLLEAAVARRLLNLSRSLEAVVRTARDVLEPDVRLDLWRQAAKLRELSLEIRPQDPPAVPEYFEE